MSAEKRTSLEEQNGFSEFSASLTLQKRVKLYCQWCVGEEMKPVECSCKNCPLFAYRTGRGPQRPRTPSQLAAASKSTEALRGFRQKKGQG